MLRPWPVLPLDTETTIVVTAVGRDYQQNQSNNAANNGDNDDGARLMRLAPPDPTWVFEAAIAVHSGISVVMAIIDFWGAGRMQTACSFCTDTVFS